MKSTVKAVVLLTLSFTLFGAALAHAQTYSNPKFEHVIIVIQENRTPDNLFGAATQSTYTATLPALGSGFDLQLKGDAQQNPTGYQWCLGSCFDPNHTNGAWQAQDGLISDNPYNSCANGVTMVCAGSTCAGQTVCPGTNCTLTLPPQTKTTTCVQDTFVSPTYDYNQADFGGIPPVYPYFDIAHKYGFANYFFQTNQGPSQRAHDFLFGGTSAPSGSDAPGVWYGGLYNEFAADNLNGNYSGCDAPTGSTVTLVLNTGKPDGTEQYPCFDHLTLADLLTNNNLTWKYYAEDYYGIWTAPSGIAHLCEPNWMTLQNPFPFQCDTYSGGDLYTENVVVPDWNFFADVTAGGTNIVPPPGQQRQQICSLPNVTWIIPNGTWSDHPGVSAGDVSTTTELGPDWVANIINAVGNATCQEPGQPTGTVPWDDTVIFVVWDDWGGFYDHIAANGTGLLAQKDCSTWGCGYTYGYRVPFLVVSQYTSPGYVSGACGVQGEPSCPNLGPTNGIYYGHDFGSILAFIENNFGLPVGGINLADCPPNAQYPCFLFADANAPELQLQNGGTQIPLGEFFGLYSGSENFNNGYYCPPGQTTSCPQSFSSITLASGIDPTTGLYYYCLQYFQNGGDGQLYDPDNDVIDND